MEKDWRGIYYYGDLYFENEGNYVYSIEVDTGHGKLTSYEQDIVVLAQQEIVQETEDSGILENLPYPNLVSVLLILSLIAVRKRR